MDPAVVEDLLSQHNAIMAEVQQLTYVVWATLSTVLIFIIIDVILKTWTVVNITARQRELEAKFNVLVELMLKAAEVEAERRRRGEH